MRFIIPALLGVLFSNPALSAEENLLEIYKKRNADIIKCEDFNCFYESEKQYATDKTLLNYSAVAEDKKAKFFKNEKYRVNYLKDNFSFYEAKTEIEGDVMPSLYWKQIISQILQVIQ